VLDECFAALGRALYLAQRYEYEAREAAPHSHLEALMEAARRGTGSKVAAQLRRGRTLHRVLLDLIDGKEQDFLLKAKAQRNHLVHHAALEVERIAQAKSRRAMSLRHRRFLARLEYSAMVLWLAYDHVVWFNEALGSWRLPEAPNLEAQWTAVREWISTDFARVVRDADRQDVLRLISQERSTEAGAPNQPLQPTKAHRRAPRKRSTRTRLRG
jgi:hypothetical protein